MQRVWTSKSISPFGPDPDRRPLGEGVAGGGEGVVEDLEDADEAEAHAEAEEAARVGHEGDHRDLLVAHDLRHHRVLQVQGLFTSVLSLM